MDDSYSGLLKFFVPLLPSITKTALANSLWLSPTSSKWDLRTEMTVHVLRAMMSGNPSTVGKTQAQTLKDPGAKGKCWAARTTIPVPQDETIREATFQAIADLGDGNESYTKPDLADTEVEWTGYRSKAKDSDPPPPGVSPVRKEDSFGVGKLPPKW